MTAQHAAPDHLAHVNVDLVQPKPLQAVLIDASYSPRQVGAPLAANAPANLPRISCMRRLKNELDTGPFVELKNSEVIPFGIHEISLPALTGDGEFGLDNRTAKPPYCLLGRIEILNLERANERIGARLGWRTRCRPRKQPPIQVSRFYPPIAFGTLVLGKPPSKNLRIKVSRSRWIVSLNLEIDGHRSSPLLSRAISTHSGATGNPSRACGEVSTNLPRAVLEPVDIHRVAIIELAR